MSGWEPTRPSLLDRFQNAYELILRAFRVLPVGFNGYSVVVIEDGTTNVSGHRFFIKNIDGSEAAIVNFDSQGDITLPVGSFHYLDIYLKDAPVAVTAGKVEIICYMSG